MSLNHPTAFNMQSFTHPLLFDTRQIEKSKQTKLFSGLDTSRNAHAVLNHKHRSRRSRPFTVPAFTLPYRTITMNNANDKSTNTEPRKKKGHQKLKVKEPKAKKSKSFHSDRLTTHDKSNNKLSLPRQLSLAHHSRTMDNPKTNEPGISERRGIRWLPHQLELEEPTSTLVLTGSKGQFVDIRIFCKQGDTLPNEGGPSQLLDWGIAGTSTSTIINEPSLDHPSNPAPPSDGTSRAVCHSTFSHWLDSRTDTPGPDQGDMYPQTDNTTLELGSMYNPLTKSEQAYEEVWADYGASAVDGKRWSVVIDLENHEHNAKGRVVRVGEHCQAILKVGEQVTVERWRFELPDKDGKGNWRRLARLGDLFLPVSLVFTPESIAEGNTLTYGEYKWTVKEVYSW
ncbi:hypothetical protein E4T38_01730 [Aureobasidium subglaciale]|nr:hypothetical protein E4T38_01730 [Aureobasidium subglaciale]KAI5222604.1 hypothetical protein E4T40_04947 [Aureobasidium subglaciale]KAI5233095.1 hypothetical protein E4T41_01728 [Aureobasidium subglaciale]KAI5262187.1 hypothetical protein E4T46_04659 [Aureobasidium subglaciale]